MSLALPKVIGHRGACAYAPENTLASMKIAKDLGVEWVEFDVQLSSDGIPVIFHDDELDRTTNGTGMLFEKNLLELKQLDAGSWFGKEFFQEKIPTLQELLMFLAKLKMSINLEIKPSVGTDEETVCAVIETLKYWPKELPIILSSFSWSVLALLRQKGINLPIAMLMHEWHENWADYAKQLSCISININQEIATQVRVHEIREQGYGILSYTVNDIKRACELFGWGVNGVFSDYPDKIK